MKSTKFPVCPIFRYRLPKLKSTKIRQLAYKYSKHSTKQAIMENCVKEEHNIKEDGDAKKTAAKRKRNKKQLIFVNGNGEFALAESEEDLREAEKQINIEIEINYFQLLDIPKVSSKQSTTRPLGYWQDKNCKYPIKFTKMEALNNKVLKDCPYVPILKMQKILRAHNCTDIRITIGDAHFRCYLSLLQSHSHFFRKITRNANVVFPMKYITPHAFRDIYEWMLSTKVKFDRNNLENVLQSAFALSIPRLINALWKDFDNVQYYNEDNAFMHLLQAQKYNLRFLEPLLLQRVQLFFLPLVATHTYVNLKLKHIKMLLSSDHIAVPDESFVFYSAVRWIAADWTKREQHIGDIMSCVRFPLMSFNCMVSLEKCEDQNIDIMRIMADKRVREFIKNAICHITIRLSNVSKAKKLALFQSMGIVTVQMRNDELANLFQDEHNISNYSYEKFQTYLAALDKKNLAGWAPVMKSRAVCF